MADVRNKPQVPVGSAQWIDGEKEQISNFCSQEVEDFAFSTRNEFEWLNEHMAEIFNSSRVNVTEIFKTPGKLRGKTPRTARKRDPLEVRAACLQFSISSDWQLICFKPLTDMFSINAAYNTALARSTSVQEENGPQTIPEDTVRSPKKASYHQEAKNTDSGFHEMSEDEMEIEEAEKADLTKHNMEEKIETEVVADVTMAKTGKLKRPSEEDTTLEGSFHSARENVTVYYITKDPEQTGLSEGEIRSRCSNIQPGAVTAPEAAAGEADCLVVIDNGDDGASLVEEDHELDASHSPSEASSPVKPLVRKSSLTFPSLPAREPLTTKKSIGNRVSRTSHIDQPKAAVVNRGSYFGRYTGGKSLGGARQTEINDSDEENDSMDLDNADQPSLSREESDGTRKIAKLHNQSSTQRLHERINQLGLSQASRPTKSVPAAALLSAQPAYPELRKDAQEVPHTIISKSMQPTASSVDTATDDEDEWIQPPRAQAETDYRPQLSKSRSVDVMERIRGKISVGGEVFVTKVLDRQLNNNTSPLRSNVTRDEHHEGPHHQKSPSASDIAPPSRAKPCQDVAQKKVISVSNPAVYSIESTTPRETTAIKIHNDGPINVSKSKLQSIMKSARGLFTSSAGVSAQAKMETLSPSSMRPNSQNPQPFIGDISIPKATTTSLSHVLYPVLPGDTVGSSHDRREGRKTRSSTEKAENGRDHEATAREYLDHDLRKAPEQEHRTATNPTKQQQKAAKMAAREPQEAVLGDAAGKSPPGPTRQSPRRAPNNDGKLQSMPTPAISEKVDESGEILHSVTLPLPRSQGQPSQIQKPKAMQRPIRPAKDAAPKPRPQPVAIRVGTLSQRIPLTNATLSSSLQEPLAPTVAKEPGFVKKASNASLQTSTSTTSFKSSVSSTASKPKALIAAERKREQDEKEAQRREEHKREMERKRAAQQEEAQKREQTRRQEVERQRERERSNAEDPRRIAQKQTIEKRRLELSKKDQTKDTQRVPTDLTHTLQQEISQQLPAALYRSELGASKQSSRLNATQEFPKASMNYPQPNHVKPPMKRVFDPDHEEEPSRPARVPGGQASQQQDSKRRRTEDEEKFEAPIRPTMAPPIRQSNIRKDGPKASIFGNNHASVQPVSGHHSNTSLLKSSMVNQAYQQHPYNNQPIRGAHPMEIAKYTNGKIPFAEAPNPPQLYRTPLPSKTIVAAPSKSSPLFTNGDNIPLDDIPTDSEEEDSEDERARKKNRPDWALTPNLDATLRDQERLNTDALFGPVAPLVMEDIFKDKNRHHRFRSRTSSANWLGQDRLTEEEIKNDNVARERLRREGGWTFGL